MTVKVPDDLVFGADDLLPVVIQERSSGDVLMVAWANADAVRLTAETGEAHFWSRSRRRIWRKGETSGNVMRVREARTDCDRDTLLLVVDPHGPACHAGTRTCFGDATPTLAGLLEELGRVIADRDVRAPEDSYTSRLLRKGLDHCLKKIGEESTEVVLAAKSDSEQRLAEEAADLLFHLLVVLHLRRIGPSAALKVLKQRRGEP